MMTEIELFTQAKEQIGERYLLVNALSKRTRQLENGAEPLFPAKEIEGRSNIEIALMELRDKKLNITSYGKDSRSKKK